MLLETVYTCSVLGRFSSSIAILCLLGPSGPSGPIFRTITVNVFKIVKCLFIVIY